MSQSNYPEDLKIYLEHLYKDRQIAIDAIREGHRYIHTAILTLAGGAFTVSATILSRVDGYATLRIFLLFSWLFLIASVFLSLYSVLEAKKALRKQLDYITADIVGNESVAQSAKEEWGKLDDFCQQVFHASIISLCLGLACLGMYVAGVAVTK